MIIGVKVKVKLNKLNKRYLDKLFSLNSEFNSYLKKKDASLEGFKKLNSNLTKYFDFDLFNYTLKNFKEKRFFNKLKLTNVVFFKDYFVFKNYPKMRFYLSKKDLNYSKVFNVYLTKDNSYYLTFSTITNKTYPSIYKLNTLGLDLGVKNFITISNNIFIPNINNKEEVIRISNKITLLRSKLDRMKNYFKKNNLSYSKNYYKLESKYKKLLFKVREIRRDYLYKSINYILSFRPRNIVIEDLSVKELVHDNPLAKRIEEATFRKFRTILEYKCKMHHINLIVANKYFPSSKMCSNCGHIKSNLSLSERTYVCPNCGFTIDRDLNAAINLKNILKKENKVELNRCKITINATPIKK